MLIYKSTNAINGMIYIGLTTITDENYLGSGKWFKNVVKKYGKENFIRKILEDNITDFDYLREREIYWIKYYDAMNPLVGYNLTKGGEGILGLIHSEESIKKMSESHKGIVPWNKGKTGIYSPETRKKISDARKGILKTKETKQNMSIAQKKYFATKKKKDLIESIAHSSILGEEEKVKKLREEMEKIEKMNQEEENE